MFTRLVVQVTDTAFPKIFEVPIKNRIIVGRSDEDVPSMRPDVDLVACNAIRNGISRQHIAIDREGSNELMLYDLGSSNGTCLNGESVTPHLPYPLNDRDRIQLGKLRVTIFLK